IRSEDELGRPGGNRSPPRRAALGQGMRQRQVVGDLVLDLAQPHAEPQPQLLPHRRIRADALEEIRHAELLRLHLPGRARPSITPISPTNCPARTVPSTIDMSPLSRRISTSPRSMRITQSLGSLCRKRTSPGLKYRCISIPLFPAALESRLQLGAARRAYASFDKLRMRGSLGG